ncbi:helix-turn-helix domain-containing protein [Actinomadura gamaensis]|uniref:Helix-turn-helix domain-containing protein n=1 Tax=Actinomadura gamaensis TaxID=1763541 RepID=A0ABV9UAI7_9ACTN
MRRVPKRLAHEPQAVTYLREQAGLNKTRLAEQCSVSLSLISEIERGTRSASESLMTRMAEVFECPPVLLKRRAD